MQAERVIIETDPEGRPKSLPKLPANSTVEAIFIVLDTTSPPLPRRQPPPAIAGKGKILGDIVGPVAPSEDWDALR